MSLRQRLLGIGLLVVVVFSAGIGSALDLAFRDVAETLRMERLQAQVYMLLASADLDGGKLSMPDVLPEPRLSPPGSGMYALIYDAQGQTVWRSGSMLGQEMEIPPLGKLGEFHTRIVAAGTPAGLFVVSYGVAWVTENGEYRFDLVVAEDQAVFIGQMRSFRQALWGWLALFVILLLAVQVAVLHWALRPLRRAEVAIQEIVAGRADRLEGPFPRELSGLVENLNKLIHNERQRMGHYRETLANLAHSLKTPLAVMKSALENALEDENPAVRPGDLIEQVERIHTLVEYQLVRAATSGKMTFHTPLPIRPVVEKLIRSLQKVYLDKQLSIEFNCPAEAVFPGVEGDLMEIVGNLMDNACKWCRQNLLVSVRIETVPCGGFTEGLPDGPCASEKPSAVAERATAVAERATAAAERATAVAERATAAAVQNLSREAMSHSAWLEIRIEDDGPGLSEEDAARLSARGVRGDETVPGQGIGLAVVRELTGAYQGHLKFGRSRWNGSAVSLFIPLD